MIRQSDSMDDLTGDLRHLRTLIRMITDLAINVIDASKDQCEQTKKEISEITDLLWIARDMVEILSDNGEAVHRRVLTEKGQLKAGGAA